MQRPFFEAALLLKRVLLIKPALVLLLVSRLVPMVVMITPLADSFLGTGRLKPVLPFGAGITVLECVPLAAPETSNARFCLRLLPQVLSHNSLPSFSNSACNGDHARVEFASAPASLLVLDAPLAFRGSCLAPEAEVLSSRCLDPVAFQPSAPAAQGAVPEILPLLGALRAGPGVGTKAGLYRKTRAPGVGSGASLLFGVTPIARAAPLGPRAPRKLFCLCLALRLGHCGRNP
mmetsp:Transcript_35312/g.83766  ORF Transcript_35312/g.83766 Transcript_35312/m.83766 type:complete len:233 (-) Transcript_35312:2990-3688(-)